MLIDIILIFLIIFTVFVVCGFIFSIYIDDLPPKKQDEVLNNLQNKFNNFWK